MTNITVRDIVGISSQNTFDPMNIDTTEIQTLSRAMPMDGNIDVNNAEVLAVKYLRGADMCGEMLAIATAHVARTKSKKDIAYNRAFLKHRNDKTVKTDKMRTALAEIDDDYIETCNRYNEALAFGKWIDAKYSSFIKMHYMCRNILKRGYEHENASGGPFNGSPDGDNENTW